MSAAALLTDLDAAGVRLARAGDDLHFETRPGVSIAPYREQITAHKPALLATLRQRELDAEVALLEHGWAWLEAHPDDPRHAAFEARWIERLQRYERSSTEAISGGHEPLPRQGVVQASSPPAGWDGALPEACGWPKTCCLLGPCPRSAVGRPCRLDGA